MQKKIVPDRNNYKIRRTAAREICVRHHDSPIEGSLETSQTLLHYGIEESNGRPNWVPLYREAQAAGQQRYLFPIWKILWKKKQSFFSLVNLLPQSYRAERKKTGNRKDSYKQTNTNKNCAYLEETFGYHPHPPTILHLHAWA